MSPVLSIISGSTFTAPTLVLPTLISSVTASELPTIATSVSSHPGSDKGLFEPPQPLTPSQILHPVHSPAPDQNPFPASDMGLSFLGIMLIVGVFLAGMLMLVSKCWGKREAKKALERMQKDEEAQAQAEDIKHVDNIPAITVSENDQKEQFIIGESESTDITTMNIDEEDEKHEDQATFYNAKRSGIIGASAVYSVDIPTVNEQDIPSASVLFAGDATKERTCTSATDTQPLLTNAEEDITDTAATKIASLESIDAVGELFLRSETSTESLSQKSDKDEHKVCEISFADYCSDSDGIYLYSPLRTTHNTPWHSTPANITQSSRTRRLSMSPIFPIPRRDPAARTHLHSMTKTSPSPSWTASLHRRQASSLTQIPPRSMLQTLKRTVGSVLRVLRLRRRIPPLHRRIRAQLLLPRPSPRLFPSQQYTSLAHHCRMSLSVY